MDAQQLSLPRLALTDEASAADNSDNSRKRTIINTHLWFVDDHESRVVFCRHEPLYQVAVNDKVHLRFIAVSLRLNGLASQEEIAKAFGHSVRAQRDWEKQFQKEGLQGLLRKPGSGRRSQLQTSQEALLRKWFQQGVTQREMAKRLGVGIDVVKRALSRLGLRRRKTTSQITIDGEHDKAPASADEEGRCGQVKPSSGTPEHQAQGNCPDNSPSNQATAPSSSEVAHEATTTETVSVSVGGSSVAVAKVQVAQVEVSKLSTEAAAGEDGLDRNPAEDVPGSESKASQPNELRSACSVPMAVTIDRDPTDRSGDRALARLGFIDDALPLFADMEQLPRAGVLLAVPLLVNNGLLQAFTKVYRSLGPSFYGLRTLVVTLFLCALLRIKRPENLKEYGPWELGRLVGLDRAPEVKTVRRKLSHLARHKRGKQLMEELARVRIGQDASRVAFLYLDGHVRQYHGKHPLSKAKKSQRQVATRAATDTWVHDASGEPLLVVTSELNEGLTQVLEPILADVRRLVGEGRMTVIFDRGGYSPKLFARLIASGFDVLTYRKGKSADRPLSEFCLQKLEVDGRRYQYTLCERPKVRVGRLRNKRKRESRSLGPQFLWMREVRVLRRDGRQTPILTNREDPSGAEVAYRAFDRWRQENYFKYAGEEFDLDALAEYAVQEVSSEADRPNPQRKRLQKVLSKARVEVARLQAELGEAAGSSQTRTMRGFKIAHSQLRRTLESAEEKVRDLERQYAQTPARVSATDLKALTTEKKLIVDTIKMAAYQVETELLGLLHGSYARSADEGRTLLHAAFQTPGKMEVREGELLITLNPQSSPHRTRAISILCEQLNQLGTCFPGTDLRLHLAVQDQKPADL